VVRTVGPGDLATCCGCGQDISFRVRTRGSKRVVCNVYVGGMWRRVEHWHAGCYEAAGHPYGVEIDLRDSPNGAGRTNGRTARGGSP
jgi:hypothetical protein